MLRRRRKVVLILGFETPDFKLNKVHRGWNEHMLKTKDTRKNNYALLEPTTSQDFLIARDKHHKRTGFIEIELEPGESPRSGVRRFSNWNDAAFKQEWQPVDQFFHTDNDTHWEIFVGSAVMDATNADQRGMDIAEQPDELPFTVEWESLFFLYRSYRENSLSYITQLVLKRRAVRAFLVSTRNKEAKLTLV